MVFRAEVHRIDSDEPLKTLGYWETHREAVRACEQHALRTLVFEKQSYSCWEARANMDNVN